LPSYHSIRFGSTTTSSQTMMIYSPSEAQEGRIQAQQSAERIPKELQDVFIAAAQGDETPHPPPSGSKIFKRILRAGNDGKKTFKRISSFRIMTRRSSLTPATMCDESTSISEALSNSSSTNTIEVVEVRGKQSLTPSRRKTCTP
jgi:hypothetical protein